MRVLGILLVIFGGTVVWLLGVSGLTVATAVDHVAALLRLGSPNLAQAKPTGGLVAQGTTAGAGGANNA